TNLAEVECDFVRIWNPAAKAYKDVNELFQAKQDAIVPGTEITCETVDCTELTCDTLSGPCVVQVQSLAAAECAAAGHEDAFTAEAPLSKAAGVLSLDDTVFCSAADRDGLWDGVNSKQATLSNSAYFGKDAEILFGSKVATVRAEGGSGIRVTQDDDQPGERCVVVGVRPDTFAMFDDVVGALATKQDVLHVTSPLELDPDGSMRITAGTYEPWNTAIAPIIKNLDLPSG
ncbi:MAG: hypothetical protein GY873_12895, partial [Bosea sp.]|uniref:hypothetical protein n=1 Tax=Bosea sp. (in: a-proteobacteria) TaxID=1871050 RepID=UPI0023851D62|nr:hypothetical protein [Bosea sp. (in: a-proteobacteria)]